MIAPRFASRSRALIVDSHSTTRLILASQMRALGVGQVVQCARARDAAKEVQVLGFDVVLCEQRLADGTLGQELIDDLRRRGQLSLRTVVIVISGDASYNVVAEVAESAVDGFIVKPYRPGILEDRLVRAFARKMALSPVFDAIESERHGDALELCETHCAQRARYWSYAARLGAELALRLDKAVLASELYAQVSAVKAVPWAKLGLARALQASGDAAEALSTIEDLLATAPHYVDAYDVLGKIHAEQGNFEAALAAYRQASEITPASLARAQRYGIVAYYAGQPDVALAALQRAAQLGHQSPQFDAQILLLLALGCCRERDAEGLGRYESMLGEAAALLPADVPQDIATRRVQRFKRIVQALGLMLRGEGTLAAAHASALVDELEEPAFDAEAAANLLSLLAELRKADVPLPQQNDWLHRIGLRFCTGRQATEMLVKACGAHPPYASALRQAQAEIGAMAEDALGQAVAGQHARAVELLLTGTERTRNLKLLHTAHATLSRHGERIAQRQVLQERCEALRAHCGPQLR